MLTRHTPSLALLFGGLLSACGGADFAEPGEDETAVEELELITGPYMEEVSRQLSRGSQPDEKWIKSLAQRGFRSVVNLRREDNRERPIVKKHGMVAYQIAVTDRDTPALGQLVEFLEFATRRDNQPVFLHCQAGKGRTGVFVGAYRINVQGWNPEDAIREAQDKGMGEAKSALLREFAKEIERGRIRRFEAVR